MQLLPRALVFVFVLLCWRSGMADAVAALGATTRARHGGAFDYYGTRERRDGRLLGEPISDN